MHWDQFAKSLKNFIAKAASPPGAEPEAYPQDLESIVASPASDDWDAAEEMTPYEPDSHGERCDSSLHLSC
jgi:hypothetical protein